MKKRNGKTSPQIEIVLKIWTAVYITDSIKSVQWKINENLNWKNFSDVSTKRSGVENMDDGL